MDNFRLRVTQSNLSAGQRHCPLPVHAETATSLVHDRVRIERVEQRDAGGRRLIIGLALTSVERRVVPAKYHHCTRET